MSPAPRFSAAARVYSEHLCRVLNGLLDCPCSAVPEYIERLGYTGRVSLSPRAVEELAARLIESAPLGPREAAEETLRRYARERRRHAGRTHVIDQYAGLVDRARAAGLSDAEIERLSS